MELEVIKNTGKELHLKVIGEDATLCNLLVKTLHRNKKVEFAAFKQEHPLLTPYEIYVRVSEGGAKRAVIEAVKEIISECRELLKQLG